MGRKLVGFFVFLSVLFLMACGNNGDIYCLEPTELYYQEEQAMTTQPAEIEVTREETETTSYIERGWLATPYLVRLLPYRNGSYTDGMNVFIFAESGKVSVQPYWGTEFELIPVKSPQRWEFDSETVNHLGAIVAYNLDMSFWAFGDVDYSRKLVHIEDDTYFFHFTSPFGGSGEAFWYRDWTFFGSICVDEHFTDLGTGAEHIVWHDGYFYFLDMVDFILATPGVGTIGRMNMDGSNRITIVDDLIIGPFQILNDRIFFSSLENGLAYSVDLAGNDRQAISEHIVPRYHRVWLEFYGDTIINRAWMSSGYSMSHVVRPTDLSNPAIMCSYGCCQVTFPHELRGRDPFVVVAYNYTYLALPAGRVFLVLRSNIDGSLWVYHRACPHHHHGGFSWAGLVFDSARKQLGEQYE